MLPRKKMMPNFVMYPFYYIFASLLIWITANLLNPSLRYPKSSESFHLTRNQPQYVLGNCEIGPGQDNIEINLFSKQQQYPYNYYNNSNSNALLTIHVYRDTEWIKVKNAPTCTTKIQYARRSITNITFIYNNSDTNNNYYYWSWYKSTSKTRKRTRNKQVQVHVLVQAQGKCLFHYYKFVFGVIRWVRSNSGIQ